MVRERPVPLSIRMQCSACVGHSRANYSIISESCTRRRRQGIVDNEWSFPLHTTRAEVKIGGHDSIARYAVLPILDGDEDRQRWFVAMPRSLHELALALRNRQRCLRTAASMNR